jgi:hypothetical protein
MLKQGHAITRTGALTLLLTLAALTLPTAAAAAGGSATIESTSAEESLQFEVNWRDDMVRMDFPQQPDAYMIVRDGKGYSVSSQGGQTMVLDMSSLQKMGQGGDKQSAGVGSSEFQTLDLLEATGDTVTIAGIEGEIHAIEWTDQQDESHRGTVVLSANPQAQSLTAALRTAAEAMGAAEADPLSEAVLERDMGVLRFDDKFELVSISGDAPAASEFELPAEPMSLQDLMRQQMGQ